MTDIRTIVAYFYLSEDDSLKFMEEHANSFVVENNVKSQIPLKSHQPSHIAVTLRSTIKLEDLLHETWFCGM